MSTTPEPSRPGDDTAPTVVGWREWVGLPQAGLEWVKAKIDTGARSSAIHAFDLEAYEQAGRAEDARVAAPILTNLGVIANIRGDLEQARDLYRARFQPGPWGDRPRFMLAVNVVAAPTDAEAACLRGERTLFVSFDSDGTEVIRNLESVGIQLGPHVASGILRMVSARTITGSAGAAAPGTAERRATRTSAACSRSRRTGLVR